jgi:uncharacterized protein (DUF58 family)
MAELFEKIRRIQFITTQLANDLLAGAYHSAFKGKGMEFEEVREYQIGDDIRSVDWNVTARMHHPYVKVYREERELTVMLVVDISASSRFGSQNRSKKEIIAEIGAVIAFSAIKNNDKIGLILFSENIELHLPPKKGLRNVLRVIRELLVHKPKKIKTDLSAALSFLGRVHQKGTICFLISDFICDLPRRELLITSQHNDLIAIQVSDPCEWEFLKMDLVQMSDLETGQTKVVDTSSEEVRKAQYQQMEERTTRLEVLMKQIGAGLIQIKTNESYIDPLRKFFKLRKIRH